MSSTAWIRLELGGSRNSRWKWATPRNVPVGETNGGCVTKTWAAIDKLKVKTADGKERPAGISEITDVRWSLRGELGAGKQGEVGFRVVIN